MLTLRFDLRAAPAAAPTSEQYRTAIAMCEWAESRGAVIAVLSEHHVAEDGHLPAPIVLASAIAARTTTLPILIAAVPITLWDPVRLAEQICVLDLISDGRVAYAFGIGHRPEEYRHFGVDMRTRGRLADEYVDVVRRLVRGEVVDYRGRPVRVTPSVARAGGPTMLIAGGSPAAARRAGRLGLGFIAQSSADGLRETYLEQCQAHGHPPGAVQFPTPGAPTAVFVADDVELAWNTLGPHLLQDAKAAASYRHGDDSVASITRADSVEEMRSDPAGPYRILTVEQAADYIRAGRPLPLHPLCGGVDSALAWKHLELAAAAVEYSRAQPGNRNDRG